MNDHYELITASGAVTAATNVNATASVRAVGWENLSCPAGSVRVRREYPGGRSEVARWLASRARRERARAVGGRHRRGCYVSACWPGLTVRIGPAPRRTLVGRSQLMVTPSGVACSCRSDPQ